MKVQTKRQHATAAMVGLFAGAMLLGGTAVASTIDPQFNTFGSLPDATFGGTGIQNDHVAVTTIQDGANTITLGLAAHGRFTGALANDGAGTYFALPGESASGTPGGATWNFDYYVNIDGPGTLEDYQFTLHYTFDPAEGTSDAEHGVLDFNEVFTLDPNTDPGDVSKFEGSQNLNFGYLADGSLPFIDAPAGAFDLYAIGQYSFALRAWNMDGALLGESGMHVQVIPLPAPVWMGLAGLAGVVVMRRRRLVI